MTSPKGFKDSFAKFFEEPSRETLRTVLENQVGETRFLDFKAQWPSNASLAKQCLGLLNTDGGCLIIGVQENDDKSLEPVGLNGLKDKADITNGLKNYIPSEALERIEIYDFVFESSEYEKIKGKKFQVALIDFIADITPVISLRAGDGIKKSTIYYRKEAVTDEVNHDELQTILARRLRLERTSSAGDLGQHLEQLRILYAALPRTVKNDWLAPFGAPAHGQIAGIMSMLYKDNPHFPKESVDAFIGRMIASKKLVIESELGINENTPSAIAQA